jgi:hypothetical protein
VILGLNQACFSRNLIPLFALGRGGGGPAAPVPAAAPLIPADDSNTIILYAKITANEVGQHMLHKITITSYDI